MDRGHSHGRRTAAEHPCTDIGQLVLLGLFLSVWITDSFVFHYSIYGPVWATAYVRFPVGATILAASALLALKAHRAVFDRTGRETGLISEGVYSFLRHPMYFGSWLFSFGMVLMTFSVSAAVVSLVILTFYYLVARYEEKLLVKEFGDRYRKYQKRVPMLFPFRGLKAARGRGTRPTPLKC